VLELKILNNKSTAKKEDLEVWLTQLNQTRTLLAEVDAKIKTQ